MSVIKRFVSKLPGHVQNELKRIHCHRQIRNDKFKADEPEFEILHQIIKPDDWVIDVGANTGFYTKRFSELVGSKGRVIAIEPILETFSILAANTRLFYPNITLLNVAASDRTAIAGMQIPQFETGLKNYYEACISNGMNCCCEVMTIAIDALQIAHPVGLVKIDTEGHENKVIDGMLELIQRDHPTMIIETHSSEVVEKMLGFGYTYECLPKSPNILFKIELYA